MIFRYENFSCGFSSQIKKEVVWPFLISVNGKSNRPLKYETTRPGSSSNKNRRVQSATARMTGNNAKIKSNGLPNGTNIVPKNSDIIFRTEIPINQVEELESINTPNNSIKQNTNGEAKGSQLKPSRPFSAFGSTDSLNVERRNIDNVSEKLKKPASVVQFEQDVMDMNKMEQEFKKTTVDLQKKLGITTQGIVY